MPQRIQMTRQRPWRVEHPDAVIVARPTWYGNDYPVVKREGGWAVLWLNGKTSRVVPTQSEARAIAVEAYANDWRSLPDLPDDLAAEWRARLADLDGRDLACWCPLDQPCHADVLLELANASAASS